MTAKLFRSLLVLLVIGLLLPATPLQAQTPPDVIGEYTINIEPQNDGSLKMAYSFTNYCATTDFPSTQFDAGVANSDFDLLTAGPTEMVASAVPYASGGSWVRFQFSHVPRAGECFDFYFTILQRRMAYPSDTGVSFVFTPGWFNFAQISKLTINWRLPDDVSLVKGFDPAPLSQENGIAVWQATNLAPDQKYTVKLMVDQSAFGELAQPATAPSASGQTGAGGGNELLILCVVGIVVVLVVVVILAIISSMDDGGYSGGSSIGGHSSSSSTYIPISYSGGGRSSGGSSSGRSSGGSSGGRSGGGSGSFGSRGSSCACVSCACACACAGGSRVGCSERGFDISRLLKKKC